MSRRSGCSIRKANCSINVGKDACTVSQTTSRFVSKYRCAILFHIPRMFRHGTSGFICAKKGCSSITSLAGESSSHGLSLCKHSRTHTGWQIKWSIEVDRNAKERLQFELQAA